MRKRAVSIISAPVRLLLALVSRLFRRRDKAEKPAKAPKADKAVEPAAGAAEPLTASAGADAPRGRRGLPARLKGLAALKGRSRILALVVLAIAVVGVVLALRPAPNDEKDVRATLDRYAAATRSKDYQTLCDSLYARDLVQRIRAAGLPCEVALRTGLEDRRNPQLAVLGVEVSGDQALARTRSTAVGEQPSVDTIKLIKQDGGWRVASLSEPGATLSPSAG